ncbi:hypothetical protein ACFVVC_01935 [Pseudarthrobacter sp. NPDC058196]|uniref:hypothetical protein n=1 Tax=Pseudarthrobacter sp. NPDC058196 TaxID=3346376 RepID=UPI0036D80004
MSPLIAQRQSVIAQLKQQAGEPGLSATLVFSKLKGDLISLESRIQRCFEQASDDVRAAATHAAAWRTDINVNPQAMRQAIGEEIGKSFASFAGGVVDGVWEPVAGTWNLVTHPESVVNLVRAFQADGPGTLKKMWDGIIDAETWQKDPARAMGKIAPGIIATILTAGEGGAALAAGRATGKVERSAATYSEKIATRFPQPETPAFGGPSRGDYRRTFFDANPGIDPSATIVHHAVEQQVSRLYPGLFSRDEINSLFNLRGIPKDINSDLHLSQLRMDWNDFYEMNPNASREQILEYKNKLDKIYGNQFTPKVR